MAAGAGDTGAGSARTATTLHTADQTLGQQQLDDARTCVELVGRRMHRRGADATLSTKRYRGSPPENGSRSVIEINGNGIQYLLMPANARDACAHLAHRSSSVPEWRIT